jgi:hypothetical protein
LHIEHLTATAKLEHVLCGARKNKTIAVAELPDRKKSRNLVYSNRRGAIHSQKLYKAEQGRKEHSLSPVSQW